MTAAGLARLAGLAGELPPQVEGGGPLLCPCHGRAVCGTAARVWCVEGGRSWQADDPQLRRVPAWVGVSV